MNPIIIDVREKDEFDAEHIEHSIHVPLSDFGRRASSTLKNLEGQPILLMCLGGKRAAIAASQISGLFPGFQVEVFQGGLREWKRQGRPTVMSRKAHLPIIRQVQLISGSLILLGSLLAYFENPAFILLTGFAGASITIAGATGFCGLAELLARMPYNRNLSPSSKSYKLS